MRNRLLGLGVVLVIVSVALVGAQQRQVHSTGIHSTGAHGSASHGTAGPAFPLELCGSHETAGGAGHDAAGHHAEMTEALGLTAEQLSSIHRVVTEACAAMTKYHEQILAVLTPEQRAKMQAHHGAAVHGDAAHGVKRSHGGR